MSCGRHWYFFCMWHLHLSFAARFRTCPTLGSLWAVTRLRNLIKSAIYIATHFVFMLVIFQVDRQRVSTRLFVFEKKMNRSVNSMLIVANWCVNHYSANLNISSVTDHMQHINNTIEITAGAPFYQHGLPLIPTWLSNHIPLKCGMELFIHS